jgi:RNA polymerase sigma-70 factor (ECF subfamily)
MTESDLFEERRLIDGARRGDEQAFETLYRRHRGYVLKIAARFGATGDAGLDVLQETFLYFFRKLPSFEHRARLTTFFYPVARNLALKRKMNGARLVPFDVGGLDEARIPGGTPAEDPARRFAEAVSGLPGAQREVALLRFVDGMSLAEIAQALDIPLGTVKSRLHHLLTCLRSEEETP